MPLPYENATSGKNAVNEMRSILRAFGAGSFGVMEDFAAGTLLVQFEYRGRHISVKASVKGYAAAWLRTRPWSKRTRTTQIAHERKALAQAQVSVYSILRDWIKGQITAVEVGILSFDAAFLGQIMLPTGETVLERLATTDLLRLPGASS